MTTKPNKTECIICPQCGKPVKRGMLVVASALEIRLGIGKNELYHAKCYAEKGCAA